MTAKTDLLRSATSAVELVIKPRGFTKRMRGVYTAPLAGDILGWLGFPITFAPDAHELEFYVTVGVRLQQLERTLADLLNEKFDPYKPASLTIPLGYLLPEKRFTAPMLIFRPDDLVEPTRRFTDYFEEFALPFMAKIKSLEDYCELARDWRYAVPLILEYRLPLALFMLGRELEAEAVLSRELAGRMSGSHPAAIRYQSFAMALRKAGPLLSRQTLAH